MRHIRAGTGTMSVVRLGISSIVHVRRVMGGIINYIGVGCLFFDRVMTDRDLDAIQKACEDQYGDSDDASTHT